MMNEEFDEEPVDLSALHIDADERARRIVARVSSRIEARRDEPSVLAGIELVLARFALPTALAAAASVAFILATNTRTESEPFGALVLPRGPAAAWVVTGTEPDVAEIATIAGASR